MKIIVFSDVHGNLPALETMLDDAGEADRYICLGDNVNYGPWSEECVQLVASLPNCTCLMGNHEESFLAGSYLGSHPLPHLYFGLTHPGFRSFDIIKSYLPEHFLGKWRFTHTLDGRNIYPDSEVDLRESAFIGHSHHQFRREINGHTLINVGSVGQNRRFINLASYAVFYPEKDEVELRNVPYDVQEVLDEMQRRGYPPECLAYYAGKERAAALPANEASQA